MRIALFTETYLPHINGVVTHVKILRDGLLQQGHEVLVVTADYQTLPTLYQGRNSSLPRHQKQTLLRIWRSLSLQQAPSEAGAGLSSGHHPHSQRIRHWPFGHFCGQAAACSVGLYAAHDV